jgi:hypothetical protein
MAVPKTHYAPVASEHNQAFQISRRCSALARMTTVSMPITAAIR